MSVSLPSSTAISGQTVTITVNYSNDSGSDASNVAVTAGVPSAMNYVAGSGEASGGVWDSTARTVSWTIPTLAAHQSGTETFQAQVK